MIRQRPLIFLILAFFFQGPLAISQAGSRGDSEISMRSTFSTASDLLTTEKTWTLDPSEINPHRQRWVLDRSVKLLGLKTFKKPPSEKDPSPRYGVHADEILSQTSLYLRGPGPWYRPFPEFHCEAEPNSWFATMDGSRQAGKVAADVWEKVLDAKRLHLSLLLAHVDQNTPERALTAANDLYDEWLRAAENEWLVKGHTQARIAEWRFYLEQAHSEIPDPCKKLPVSAKKRAIANPPTWESMMEPLQAPSQTASEKLHQILARCPARRWNGLFSVRVEVEVGDKTLNGQFLIDSGAAVSIVSPTWLESQGMNSGLIKLKNVPPQRVSWRGGSGLAETVGAVSVGISGLMVPMDRFLLMETNELFTPPQHVTACCDGILGADFLRLYAVQLLPGPPAEVLIWPRHGFEPKESTWVEVASTYKGELVSSCVATETAQTGVHWLPGVRWDTGSEVALDIHLPWQKLVRSSKSRWDLLCDAKKFASQVPPTLPRAERAGSDAGFLQAKVPAMNVGMELLGRGPVTFDLGHGRIWFSQASLEARVPENRSGLHLHYLENKTGDRELRVKSVEPRSSAQELVKAGLRAGALILKLDTKAAEEMDLWEVEQRLSGVFGPQVTLVWKIATGSQSKILKLR